MPRPSKRTPEVEEKILKNVRAGMHLTHCARFAGISEDTLRRWLEKGERSKGGPLQDFYQRFIEAEGKTLRWHLRNIKKAAREDPRNSQFFLSRRYPAQYGRKDNADDAGKAADRPEPGSLVEMLADRLSKLMPPEEPEAAPTPEPPAPAPVPEGSDA